MLVLRESGSEEGLKCYCGLVGNVGHSRRIVRDQETMMQVQSSKEQGKAFNDGCITPLFRLASGADTVDCCLQLRGKRFRLYD